MSSMKCTGVGAGAGTGSGAVRRVQCGVCSVQCLPVTGKYLAL